MAYVYFVRFLNIGDLADAQAIAGIIPAPEKEDLDFKLAFESQGYWLDRVDLNKLADEGKELLRELNINPSDYYED